jgi:sorting nexin-8
MMFFVLVDKEFIEERRRSLKHFLEILCRHPIICETEIIKFFLTFQGTVRIIHI